MVVAAAAPQAVRSLLVAEGPVEAMAVGTREGAAATEVTVLEAEVAAAAERAGATEVTAGRGWSESHIRCLPGPHGSNTDPTMGMGQLISAAGTEGAG